MTTNESTAKIESALYRTQSNSIEALGMRVELLMRKYGVFEGDLEYMFAEKHGVLDELHELLDQHKLTIDKLDHALDIYSTVDKYGLDKRELEKAIALYLAVTEIL